MKRIVFMGTPDFAVPVLDRLVKEAYDIVLVVTQPDRPKGRKRILSAPPVKEAAIKYNIPVFQPEKLSAETDTLLGMEIDLIVTAAYGQLLPKSLLDHPKYGCINVHASMLPELRGGAPIHYAILQGKKETGITIMYMAEKLDAGDIISQRSIPILPDDHVGTMHDKLSQLGAELLMETLPSLFTGEIRRISQNESMATFAPNITREQEKIDFNESNKTVYNHIRGLHPWPVAYTLYQGDRMKVWWAELDNNVYENRKPGEIIAVGSDSMLVSCGNNRAVALTDIQLSGKKRMQVNEYLKGNPDQFKPGQRLG